MCNDVGMTMQSRVGENGMSLFTTSRPSRAIVATCKYRLTSRMLLISLMAWYPVLGGHIYDIHTSLGIGSGLLTK